MEKAKLAELKLQWAEDEDCIGIYTKWGIYDPGKPLGHLCPIGTVHCQLDDEEDAGYQIVHLFVNSPEMLSLCKKIIAFADSNDKAADLISSCELGEIVNEIRDCVKEIEPIDL